MIAAQHNTRIRSGFTLVELSIVLVILGLLTGGILAGQSLIRAAELRALSTEANRMVASTYAFRDKYFGLPGDLSTATRFWDSLGGDGSNATCQVLPNDGTTATCNGDGDGTFGINFGSVSPAYEQFRFWQHLANAGLIEGTYTGVEGAGHTPNVNALASKSSSQNMWVAFSGYSYGGPTTTAYGGSTTLYATNYGRNGFMLRSTTQANVSGSLALKPEEAWNVEVKMDDGSPINGKIISNKGDGTNTFCTTSAGAAPADASNATSTYRLDNPAKDCVIYLHGYF